MSQEKMQTPAEAEEMTAAQEEIPVEETAEEITAVQEELSVDAAEEVIPASETADAAKESVSEEKTPAPVKVPTNKSYEEMTIEELQEAILEKMRKNGPITDRMLQDVRENVYHNSLVTWVKSFW